ncbi:elongation factor G [Candidatus Shapirobacteria bacterium]|nr:elongation factor G [Candidatus Shapirobacteria bacterium]
MAQPIEVTKNRDVPLGQIRNIGIIAHVNAGKTTTTERMLFETGRTYKLGSVDEGSTVTDWMDQERERGITIMSAAVTTFWQGLRINIIDTPGHIDFTAEVERSLRVLDGAVMVFDGRTGVEAQSETVWRQADRYFVPRICVFNKLNLVGADFESSVKSIKERLGANSSPIQITLGISHELRGAIDLVKMKAYAYEKAEDRKLKEIEIPREFEKMALSYREKLLESLSEVDDQIMEKFLNGQEIEEKELKAAIRKAVIANKFFPIMGGDSQTVSVQLVLNAIVDYLPSPLDLPPTRGINPKTQKEEAREAKKEAPFSALLFKIQTDPHVGRLSYLRVYSGTIKSGSSLYNSTRGNSERIGRLLLMHANKREGVEQAFAGEIIAAIGLSTAKTGDTLCDPQQPIVFGTINFPDPVISLAIEPKTKADQEKLGKSLNRLGEEDPTFQTKADPDTGQTIIAGMGELHLEVLVERMKREFGVGVNVGHPQVAYRETITKIAQGEGKYIRQTGGRGQYGHCLLRVEPRERGAGFEFVSQIRGAAIPANFIPAIEKGVREAMEKGVIANYPFVDIKVAVYDGSYHDVDSSEMAFKIAGSIAFQEAVKQAEPVILEPIMKLEVTTPEESLGSVMGDLSGRRAQILGTEERGRMKVINALVPLASIRGYVTIVRSLTQGRGSPYLEPSHYEQVPKNIQAELTGVEKK